MRCDTMKKKKGGAAAAARRTGSMLLVVALLLVVRVFLDRSPDDAVWAAVISQTYQYIPTTTSTLLFDASPVCTGEQNERQLALWCQHNNARHNLVSVFALLRFHLPDADLLVDVGANKGLVSARWLELWRPQLQISSKDYALNHVKPYFARKKVTKIAGSPCGVTNMCNSALDAHEMKAIRDFAPLAPPASTLPHSHSTEYSSSSSRRRPTLEVHSFEPSPHLYNMHMEFQANVPFLRPVSEHSHSGNNSNSAIWKWHKIAASDYDGDVYFNALWHEGSKIEQPKPDGPQQQQQQQQQQAPNTRSARLDTLVYQDGFFGGGGGGGDDDDSNNNDKRRIIDVLKIDAENVDLKVVAGCAQLLVDQRIRVIMWETPNEFEFPVVSFPESFGGGTVKSFGEVIHRMDVYAGMTCYFPAKERRNIKITGCWENALDRSPKCKESCPFLWGAGCPVDHGNALCVSRTLAPALYRAMEAQALIY